MERQIIIKGRAFKTTDEISDKYFNSRPLGSKIGALVSTNQSSVIPSRSFLEDEFKKIKKQFKNINISRPINWGGFIVKPIEYEFWQGRENRLHDRIRYNKKDNKWIIEKVKSMKRFKMKKLAAIDIGSNALRLLIANTYIEDNNPTYKKISLIRLPIRLGNDVFFKGKISQKKLRF